MYAPYTLKIKSGLRRRHPGGVDLAVAGLESVPRGGRQCCICALRSTGRPVLHVLLASKV